MEDSAIEKILQINVQSAIWLTREAVKHMTRVCLTLHCAMLLRTLMLVDPNVHRLALRCCHKRCVLWY